MHTGAAATVTSGCVHSDSERLSHPSRRDDRRDTVSNTARFGVACGIREARSNLSRTGYHAVEGVFFLDCGRSGDKESA